MALTVPCLLFSVFALCHVALAQSGTSRIGALIMINVATDLNGITGTCKVPKDAYVTASNSDVVIKKRCDDFKKPPASFTTTCNADEKAKIKNSFCDNIKEVGDKGDKEIVEVKALLQKSTSNCKKDTRMVATDWLSLDTICTAATTGYTSHTSSLHCTKEEYKKFMNVSCSASTLLAGVIPLVVFLFSHFITK